MSIDLYVALLGMLRLGLVATFLDPSAGRRHIEQCCAVAQPKAMIASSRAQLLRLTSPALRRIHRHFTIGFPMPGTRRWSGIERYEPRSMIVERHADDSALLTFTSGSTGQPKAAARSHGLLLAQHAALMEAIELAPDQIDLATLPVFTLANLASGVTTLIPDADLRRPGFVKADPVLRQIATLRPTRVIASPAFLDRLADRCLQTGVTMECFTKMYTGGAPVFPRLLAKLHKVAPRAEVVAVYGSTEAEPIAHMSWRQMAATDVEAMLRGRGLLAGKIVPQIQLRIIPNQWGRKIGPFTVPDFDAHALQPGSAGEIVVAGEHVLKTYLHGVGNEQTKFAVDGVIWHRTGDAGYVDGGGRLWLLGRTEALIRDKHGEIYPFAVECAAMRSPAVRRAALVAYTGKRLLVVEPHPAAPPDLAAKLLDDLRWAPVDDVLLVKYLPVDQRHNAKVDYPALRKLVARLAPPS